jgi:hypothetical protein
VRSYSLRVHKKTESVCRSTPVDLISFPAESDERFIRPDGTIRIAFKDVHRLRC